MNVSLNGLLRSVGLNITGEQAGGYRYALAELLKNLKELKSRKAEGEKVIDEFFELYVVD